MVPKCSFRVRGALSRATHSARNCCRTYRASCARRQPSDQRLRILFCGSEEFSAFSLRALSEYARSPESNIDSIDVVTRKDKHVGRGLQRVKSPPIKTVAEELQLPLHQIDTFTGWAPPSYGQDRNSPSVPNLVIAVAFGLLVPPRILRSAAYGGVNVHPSLLPQFKGAAPIQWTILQGLETTGVSLQTLHESKFDEGVVLDRISTPIQNPQTCTFSQLRHQLGPVGAALLVKGLREKRYLSHDPIVTGSKLEQTSYAPKIRKQHAAIDPQVHGSRQILRMQRAFSTVWAYSQNIDGKVLRVVTDSIGELETPLPDFFRPSVAAIPIGVPYGILSAGKRPEHGGQAPLFLNTIDGRLGINTLTVSGAALGHALSSAAKGRLLEHHSEHLTSPDGEVWDIYKFCYPLHGETDGLPAIIPEVDGTPVGNPTG